MATDDVARALAIKAIQGGGGTNVVANPTLAGTEAELAGLQVGETKYKVGGGNQIKIWRKDTEDTYVQEFDRETNTVKTINGLPAAAVIDNDVLVIDKILGFILNLSQEDYTAILNAINDDYSFSFTTTALFSPMDITKVLITVANDAVLAGWNNISPLGPYSASLGSCYVGSYVHDIEMSLSTVDTTFTYTFTFKASK